MTIKEIKRLKNFRRWSPAIIHTSIEIFGKKINSCLIVGSKYQGLIIVLAESFPQKITIFNVIYNKVILNAYDSYQFWIWIEVSQNSSESIFIIYCSNQVRAILMSDVNIALYRQKIVARFTIVVRI